MDSKIFGRKLLVLGGGNASYDVVKVARDMGIYVIAVDMEEKPGISRLLADEQYQISTTDMNGLLNLIKEKKIDGVFCGPSELRIIDAMTISQIAGLNFYCTPEQWEICSNKRYFKDLCVKYNVPCVPEYKLNSDYSADDLKGIKYPVVVKPVDGCSSSGLSVCWDSEQIKVAINLAKKNSRSGDIIVEKYITSDCGFSCRYIVSDGKFYLYATNDRFTVDEVGGNALISSVAVFPSGRTDYYETHINNNVINMFKSLGINNGTLFMQALYDYDDKQIYFHEMGLRLSGGLIYPILKAACGYSDLEMMIRLAVGGKFATPEDLLKINPYMNGKCIGSLCIPLKTGIINRIEGLESILEDESVIDCVQYYHLGDEIGLDKIGTLGQHFCRIKIYTDSKDLFLNKIKWIQDVLKIYDEDGNSMIYKNFDTNRFLRMC